MAAEEKGYEDLPPLDESVAAHLCPPTAIGWKARDEPSVQEPHLHSLDAPTRLPVAQGLRRLRQLSQRQPPLTPDLLRVGEIEGAHALHNATPSRSAKDPGPRLPWIRRLRSPPYQPGRKRKGAEFSYKQPLMCLSPPRLMLGAEESVFLVPHRPNLAPRCLIAVIADKIKHIYFQKESKSLFMPTISVLPLCSQSLQPFQPLATRAEVWQAIPGQSG